jgi:hypothetical protein
VIEGNEQKAVVDLNRLAPIYHQLAAVVRVTPDGRANRLLTELGQEIGVVPDPLKAALEALQALQATKLVEVQDSYVRRIFRHVRRGENLGAALGLIDLLKGTALSSEQDSYVRRAEMLISAEWQSRPTENSFVDAALQKLSVVLHRVETTDQALIDNVELADDIEDVVKLLQSHLEAEQSANMRPAEVSVGVDRGRTKQLFESLLPTFAGQAAEFQRGRLALIAEELGIQLDLS